MHKAKTTLTCIAIAFLVTACASGFQRPEPTADYGSPPQGYEEAIKAHFEPVLKDPESARYRFGYPVKAYANEGSLYGDKVSWVGYLVNVEVNAKNSFGGYTGSKPYMVLFSGDRIVRVYEGREGVRCGRWRNVIVQRME
jgi:hypothetical protein